MKMNIRNTKVNILKNIISSQLRPLVQGDYIYLDVPYHANLGDTLIWQGTLDFLKTLPYKCLHSSWYNSTKYKDIADKNPNCHVILHGGGNFGDVWVECHKFRKKVIEDLPYHKIIIFPQTIYYQEEKNLKVDAEFFSKYPNVTICARDKHSLKTLEDYFPNNPSLLVPDMAFFMDDHWLKPETTEDRSLFLMRTDHELKDGETLNIPEGADISDWPTLNSFGGKLRYNLLRRFRFGLNRVDSLLESNIEQRFTDFYWKNILRPYNVKLVVDFLQSYKHIYTTRMHAGILGVILGKSDINIYDNAYGKMAWFYETWLSDVEGIRMLNNNSKK